MRENSISSESINKFQNNLSENKTSDIIRRSVSKNGILASSTEIQSDELMKPVFSVEVSEKQDVPNQKQSGRCWMFAALNTMRYDLTKNFGLPADFELSQNFINFWDKFEKSNYFLENVLATANEPINSRKVSFLMQTPQEDGGQWDMLCSLIEKHGLAPKSAMEETFNSEHSGQLNNVLNTKLRKNAKELRKMVADSNSNDEINAKKESMLNEIYQILVYALGKPADKFDFEYYDKDHKYNLVKDLTPIDFYKQFLNLDLEDYVSIINSPTDDKPFNDTYTIEMLGSVVGGRSVKHLNLEIEEMKDLAIKQLKDGESVWFGCDVGKESDRQKGIMDTNLFHKDELLGADLSMSKADRLNYGESLMTHAMVLTGVDIVNGKPTKWKVENSWGDKVGTKGYFVMSDDWFNEFVYQVVVNTRYMSDEQKKNQQKEPKMLDPWDPMGALA
ncbi:aminopeptidase [Lactobacillus sp. S2-2]|uniref:C1 family peptidase n=1 Tax=Lactobacillus sp. S2-2 TaxID=2692917 RepID=UPI001F45BFFC|nr:C1 family peptidase [Lactobacillus sp. S2-2]MCF6515635.1 aminopeptidase [Lactobacillus sp. S2-2]